MPNQAESNIGARGVALGVYVLGVKPLVDFLWRFEFGTVGDQVVNIPALYGILIAFAGSTLAILGAPILRGLLPLAFTAVVSFVAWGAQYGLSDILRIWTLFGVSVIALQTIRSPTRLILCLEVYLACLTPLMLVLALQTLGFYEGQYFDFLRGQYVVRPSGGLPHPLGFVMLAIPAIGACYVVASAQEYARWWRRRNVLIVLAYSLALCVILSSHRVGTIAAIGVLGYMEIYCRNVAGRSGRIRFVVLALTGAILLLPRLYAFFVEFAVDPQTGNVTFTRLNRGRFELWSIYWRDFIDGGLSVWMLGRGSAVRQLGYDTLNEPHNDYLRILVSYGALALLCFAAVLSVLLRLGSSYARSSEPWRRSAGLAICGSTTALVLLSMTVEPSRYPSGWWLVLVLGAGCAGLANYVSIPVPTGGNHAAARRGPYSESSMTRTGRGA